jgi:PPOX class probable F420-dependent enzyme
MTSHSSVLPAAGTPFGDRVRDRLETAVIAWFTSVGGDGTPQPNPVWFLWDEPDELIVYNRPAANRLAHIRQRPRVSLNLDGNGKGGDIVVLTGRATLAPELPAPHENPRYLAKYADHMRRVSGSPEDFSAAYPVGLRIKVDRVRGF